ncbi:hypothetical protein CFSAN002369_11122 [Clostridium botulinum CFSAN002369]|nr:hypothetical protein CFSAN002369_11122 [Clostridium botulinum CFSAN002369]
MNNILENSISDVLVKPIDTAMVPKSNKVDSRTSLGCLMMIKLLPATKCISFWNIRGSNIRKY